MFIISFSHEARDRSFQVDSDLLSYYKAVKQPLIMARGTQKLDNI